jgi:hypothetical protein
MSNHNKITCMLKQYLGYHVQLLLAYARDSQRLKSNILMQTWMYELVRSHRGLSRKVQTS